MIKNFGAFVGFLMISTFCYGQSNNKKVAPTDSIVLKNEEIYYRVDQRPEFPGGMGEFYKYLFKNMKYPKDAKKQGISGKVHVQFIIDSTGYVIQDQVKIHSGLSPSCDEEAIRLIKESPKWLPGRSSALNKNVPVRMIMPITF